MRLRTIWTSGYPIAEKLLRTREWVARAAAHRVPDRFAYWVLVDRGVRHMRHDEVVPDVPFMAVLERAGKAARL